METVKNKGMHHMLIILNYAAMICFVALFEYYRSTGIWSLVSISAVCAALLVFILSFYVAYGRSGSWKLIHIPFKKLDEREAGIVYESLRIAYAAFSVIALIALLVYALGEFKLSIMVFAFFLLLAHILPASVISWRN